MFWFEKRVFSGNKHRLTGLVLHVVSWVLGLQLLAAYDIVIKEKSIYFHKGMRVNIPPVNC